MRARAFKHWVIPAAILILLSALTAVIVHIGAASRPGQRTFPISAATLGQWQPYGGSWDVLDGAIHNSSNDRGVKLLTGSPGWANYTFQADLRFDSNHGDMGLVVRSNEEEEGVDAYRGYYAGLRTVDGTLVIGRADYGWMEAQPVPMPGGVDPTHWFRLTLTAVGCRIGAEAEDLSTHQSAWSVLEEHPCLESGRIGLRSLSTGGLWQNISIAPAGSAQIDAMLSHAGATIQPEFARGEADYNRFRSALTQYTTDQPHVVSLSAEPTPVTRIADLLDAPDAPPEPVVVRGVVTLSHPDLYVQDTSGGILVRKPVPASVQVGDVVEVRGVPHAGLFSSSILASSIRLLWVGTPVPPIAVTAAQASSGAYDERYVEVEGRLVGWETLPSGGRAFLLDGGTQSFRAVLARGLDDRIARLEVGSTLRLRGICVLDQAYTRELTPFVVLLGSGADLQLVAAPPWWTPWHVGILSGAILICALLLQVAYFRFQEWKTAIITLERERLAHDIHDTMAQSFAGVGYQIQAIRKTVLKASALDRTLISAQLGTAYQLVRHCHEEASRTIAILSPASPLISENLLATLARAAHQIAGEQIKTVTCVEGVPFPLPLAVANGYLHIGREAVVNAAAHASPTEIVITLRFGQRLAELIVSDNGSGFVFAPDKAGFGILGMQKRAGDIGGILHIESQPGLGTEVHIRTRINRTHALRRALVHVARSMSALIHSRRGRA